VTAFTLLRSVLIEENVFAFQLAVVLVATGARHVLVQAREWELRPLIVIEFRRLPLSGVMAIDAGGHAILGELLAVGVLVTFLAFEGSGGKVGLDQLSLHIGRLVAIDAGGGPVGTDEREFCLGVVETLEVIPLLGGVAGLAAEGSSVGAQFLHGFGELALVRIFVAGFAIQVFPMVENDGFGGGVGVFRLLVAVGAGHGDVAAGESKAGVFVALQGERGRLPAVHCVATLALVEVRRLDELAVVAVLVTVGAFLELDLEESVFSLGNMALGAVDGEVLAFERVVAGVMVLGREGGWFPAVDGVAGGAFDTQRTLGKLTVMRIGQVAIGTLGEGDFFFEISALVAGGAVDGGVLAKQRIFGFGMVEVFVHSRQRDFLPSRCGVAGLATLREFSVVKIGVAIGALAEREPGVARLAVVAGLVALLAFHLRVQARERIAGLTMVKLADRDRLPVGVIVALETVRAEAALVLIFVAGGASLRDSEETAG